MNIELTKDQIDAIGWKALEPYGVSEDNIRWTKRLSVDLTGMTKTKSEQLKALLSKHVKVRGIPPQITTIETWLTVLSGVSVRCKRIKDFDSILKQYLKDVPRHWIYERKPESDFWQPYYVSCITYTPPKRHEGWTAPAYVTLSMCAEELGQIKYYEEVFHQEDVQGKTAAVALADGGYAVESEHRLAEYEKHRLHYIDIHDKVGMQFEAVGTATDDVDQLGKDRSYYYRDNTIRLDRDGVPARLVVDVRYETDKEDKSKATRPDGTFWNPERCDHEGSVDDDDNDIQPDDVDAEVPAEEVNVPLDPALVCFDLRRHMRLKVHVYQMTKYVYQNDLADKLILPPDIRAMVDLLVSHRGGFKDIVGGKGTGAIVLCAGSPGTGKTLTSEVYSEAMSKPLYTVQCSQLGTDPNELETNLRTVFVRAQRWDAILLLDEADVYVAARGRDLTQNAIVGVFLRVLEYYSGIMFLTTNRADLVDDAVASRCLARIDYAVPTPPDQMRIWRTLADTSGIELADSEIAKIVGKFPGLSGRDVKNLLKLGSMVVAADGGSVTAGTIEFVKRFKPTKDAE